MKSILVCMAALSFAAPALAGEWPKQDWRLLKVTPMPQQTPSAAQRDGGASPPQVLATGPVSGRLGGPAPGSRQNIALDLNSIDRTGDNVELRYFVWPDGRSEITEVSSRIDCSRTGEQVVSWRRYDRDFVSVGAGEEGVRRTDATARAVAGYACHPSRGQNVSGKSLPEVVRGG
ncbi:hypothetical protein [Caulobacter sp. UNC358MFTsu5.1]|uniref:hypothetical protein n=1 Tax=Caulobacter sp. UNC358MFTsu5.1 TaxID=1449049 RepID=UPI0004A760AA|nr:hypothetical protein [Caulobacter sp. UNC358MFTsu5.1]